jgi:hypothetical protein
MQRIQTTIVLGAGLLTAPTLADDLDLSVESSGSNEVWVQAGDTVNYAVVGELAGTDNQGLAFFTFDLSFDGGPLPPADAPTSAEMLNFAIPLGINNPLGGVYDDAGFGGTPSNGDLLQCGGGQNTINQGFAAFPSGSVVTGIAAAGAPETLLTGSFTAPATDGDYTLSLLNLLANAISAGTTGAPHWDVDALGEGAIEALVVHVTDCIPSVYCSAKVNSLGCTPELSFSGTPTLGGPNDFRIRATNVVNKQFGLMFWGLTPDNTPWLGGTLCVSGPLERFPVKNSGGGGPAGTSCDGTLQQLFPQGTLANHGITAGTQVYCQMWYRDANHADGTGVGLTAGVTFAVCP